jgi:glycosyltransferase involved in cell wall biosynthesis
VKKKVTAEEFVHSLYRILLNRNPDTTGFIANVRHLKKTKDMLKTVKSFIDSDEYKQKHVSAVVNSYSRGQRANSGANSAALADLDDTSEKPTFDVKMVLEASRHHFRDFEFIYELRNVPNLVERKKRKVRTIAIYYHRLHDGGTERVTAWQINAWTRMGYKVVLLADEGRHGNDYSHPKNIERIVIPSKMMWGDQGEYFPRGEALAKALQQCKPDLFVTNLTHELCTVWDVLVAKSLDIPVVIGWHNVFDSSFHDGTHLDLARVRLYGYRYADLIHVLNDTDRLWYTLHGAASRVIRNAPTFDKLPDTLSTLDNKTIVWVARVERHQKRVDHAIQMLPYVLREHPDAKLVIVGGGPDLEWARDLAKVLGISSRVRFTGYSTDVRSYFQSASVHIATSEFEGYMLVLEEAWAFGVPTVMYELPYLEPLKPGKGFVAVPQGDVAALAAAVSKLLSDNDLRKRMGADARAACEESRNYSVEDKWRQLFDDIAVKDNLGEQFQGGVNSSEYSTVIRHLSEKMFPVPKPPLHAPPTKRDKHWFDNWLSSVELRLPSKRRGLGSSRFVPLKTIDLTHIPFGDNIMLWTGLFTLLDHGLPVVEVGCKLHTHDPIAKVCRALFDRFGIETVVGSPREIQRPYYTPHPPKTLKESWRAYFGSDWYMDWVESTDRQKTIPRANESNRFWELVRLSVSERVIYKRKDWKSATPGYNGYRVWWPIAMRLGVKPVVFYSMMCQSLQSIRQIMGDYVDELIAESQTPVFSDCAAFPVGNAYQTIDAASYESIMRDVGPNIFTCFVQEDSAWRPSYSARGIKTTNMRSVEETFKVIRNAKAVFTCCSFTSHVAQLLRDDFVLAMFKDFPTNTVHPGARPTLVTSIPACAPCNYLPRENHPQCPAGYDHCCALDDPTYRKRIAAELKLRSN